MSTASLLEALGEVEPIDRQLLDSTADMLREAVHLHTRGLELLGPLRPAIEPLGPGGRRTPRRMVWRVAVAVSVAVAVGAGGVLLRPGSTGGPASAAAAELHRLAVVAADQPATDPPGPGQFMYTESLEAYTSSTYDVPGGGFTVQYPESRQIWIGSDGSGRLVESFGPAVFLSPQDRTDWVAAGSPDLAEGPTDESFGPGGLSDGPTDLSTLPTDPHSLAAEITSGKVEGGPPGPAEAFTQVGDLLRETDASPALRSALYQVAAGLPGVTLLGPVTDHSGRPGVGIAYVQGGTRHELIFDPTDSALLGEEDVVVGAQPGTESTGAEPVGTVADWVVYLSSGVVGSDGAGTGTVKVPSSNGLGTSAQVPATGASAQ